MALKDRYLTISEAASKAGVTRQTVSRWVADGHLVAEKVGRQVLIEKKKLAQYMAEQDVIQAAMQIVNEIIVRIREKYGYTDDDMVEFRDFDRRKTFLFSVTKKDGAREMVSFDIGKVEPLESKAQSFMLLGYKVPIKKIERRAIKKQ